MKVIIPSSFRRAASNWSLRRRKSVVPGPKKATVFAAFLGLNRFFSPRMRPPSFCGSAVNGLRTSSSCLGLEVDLKSIKCRLTGRAPKGFRSGGRYALVGGDGSDSGDVSQASSGAARSRSISIDEFR